ncbi:MAG: FtsW/RodA/SpoVE family cell cycle protein, partial [Lentisphaeria bacterium]|nr:FtsW/RodA/SpoVE family cell cycle protein [Lentisphaeria bacterium]
MNLQRTIGFESPQHDSNAADAANPERVVSALRWMLLLTTVLVVFGLTMLYSASYGQAGLTYFKKQLLWVVLGIGAATVTFLVGYRKLAAWSPLWMGICFVALMVAKFCFDPVKGGNRWLRLPGGVTIQPSEFAKIALILFIANYCSEHQRTFSRWRGRYGILPLLLPTMAVIGAILMGRDLGTTLLAITTTSLALFAAGLPLRYMVFPLLFVALAGTFIYFFDPTRLGRVTSFMHPEAEGLRAGKGYQLWISLMALGSGNWFGIGFMASRMKAKYLPEAHTDFILSVIGEELGFAAMAILILLYSLWGFFSLRIALSAGNRLGT